MGPVPQEEGGGGVGGGPVGGGSHRRGAPDGCWAPGLSEVPEDVLYLLLLDFFFRVADFVIVWLYSIYIYFIISSHTQKNENE